MTNGQTASVEAIAAALQASWALDTAAEPGRWSPDRPALTQCDASSFVAWELLGGDLVLGRVLIDGAHDQYHYWNRVEGVDIDLTASQFDGHEVIEEIRVVPSDELRARSPAMRAELRERIERLRGRVHAELSDAP